MRKEVPFSVNGNFLGLRFIFINQIFLDDRNREWHQAQPHQAQQQQALFPLMLNEDY